MTPRTRALLVLALAPLAVAAAQFTAVRATNFGSHDEWLVLSLAARGLVSFPYADRPLALIFSLPAEWILPHDVRGHLVAHVFYLGITGAVVGWLALGRLGLSPVVALLAGVFTATWAPLDISRLDSVLVGTRYGGTTAAALVAIALFVEGHRRGRPLLAVLGGVVAVVAVLTIEGVVPVLAGAPLLVLAAAPATLGEADRRGRFLRWSAAWELLLVASIVPVLLSLARRRGPADGYNYQAAIGFDPNPLHIAAALLKQVGFALGPLVQSPLAELARRPVAVAVAVFLLAFLALGRATRDGADDRPLLARTAALGATLAVLGWIALVVSPLVRTPARAQLLSAPGTALLLASGLALLASWAPVRARALLLAVAGAWVVAVGGGRVAALQDDLDALSSWPAQRQALVQMIAEAPSLAPNTLVLLVDERHVWPVNFGFRHAIQYLYGEDVVGVVWNGHQFLYGVRYEVSGIRSEPWPVIQRVWRSPPTIHRYDEVVAVRLSADGRLAVLDAWPPELPPLPPAATYAPRARIGPGPPAESARILDRES